MAKQSKSCGRCQGTGNINNRRGAFGPLWDPCPDCGATGRIELNRIGPKPPGSSSGCLKPLAVLFVIIIFIGVISDDPATDGVRPEGVSQEQHESNPRYGKLEIERCGSLYKYYDTEFMRKHRSAGARGSGYTFSATPPYEEVDFIVEAYTVHKRSSFSDGKTVSRRRKIPRHKVTPVDYTPGNYLNYPQGKTWCESFYYTPPSTASEQEKAAVQKLMSQPK